MKDICERCTTRQRELKPTGAYCTECRLQLATKKLDILLPRNYLSYSAMFMWIKSESRFRKEYFEGAPKLDTKYLRFGKAMAEARESQDLKPGEFAEYKIETYVKGVPILSYIDFYDSNKHEFSDDKPGKIAWTDSKVQKHEQFPFYATALKWQKGVTPKKCALIWFETMEGATDEADFWNKCEKKLSLTGKVVRFERELDEREVKRMEDLIVKSAIEISDAYKEFIQQI